MDTAAAAPGPAPIETAAQQRVRHIRADLVRAKDMRPQMLNKNEVHKSACWFLWHLITSGEPISRADVALARSVMESVR